MKFSVSDFLVKKINVLQISKAKSLSGNRLMKGIGTFIITVESPKCDHE